MKTIGMLGGMSWESTELYYRLTNEHVRERVGGLHSAPILLDSVDFAEIADMQRAGEWAAAGRLLAERAARLASIGADMIVLCTNTMHKVFDEIDAAVEVPVLHIADATATAVSGVGLRRVGLLGTAFTMEQDFYRSRMAAHGIEVIVPDAADRDLVHRVIFEELVHGIVDPGSRAAYRQIIERLVASGAEGIVLGCTEIELLVRQDDCDVPVFPTAAIHVASAVEAALS
jgi:aspartate racemase